MKKEKKWKENGKRSFSGFSLLFTFFSETRKSFLCLCRDVDVAVVVAVVAVVVAKNRFQLKVSGEVGKVC